MTRKLECKSGYKGIPFLGIGILLMIAGYIGEVGTDYNDLLFSTMFTVGFWITIGIFALIGIILLIIIVALFLAK